MPVKRSEKTPMPVRDAQLRAHDFTEVNAGYTQAHAAFEAERCVVMFPDAGERYVSTTLFKGMSS